MDYKELEVWKESKDLVKQIYKVTESFPSTEQFGLINQIRRCSISIPSNIAEGIGRNHAKTLYNFFSSPEDRYMNSKPKLFYLSNYLLFQKKFMK